MQSLKRIFEVVVVILTLSNSITANKKLVGSKDCIIAQYCEESNAIDALQTTFAMSEESAIEYMTNRTIVRSCSCHDSCAYLDLCCQDKQVHVPQELSSIANRLSTETGSYSCQKTLERNTVVVNTCPDEAQAVMKQRCAVVAEYEQLVTSNVTTLTYKNMYCGLCNGETYEQLLPWSWSYDCYIKKFPNGITTETGVGVNQQAINNGCSLNQTTPQIPPNMVEVHHAIGVYLDNATLCTSPPITSCPAGADKSHDCENKPISLISYDKKVYKNEHCLRCNEGSSAIASAICESCENEGCKHKELNSEGSYIGSFGILVQPYDDTDVVKCKTTNQEDCGDVVNILKTCGHGQYLDYQTSKCLDVCPDGFVLRNGACVFVEETCQKFLDKDQYKGLQITTNETKQLHRSTFMVLGLPTTPCYNCNNLTAITRGQKNFHINENGQVKYKSSIIDVNFVYKVDNVTFYVCMDDVLEINTTTYEVEEIITNFLLSLSILGLLLYFAAYITFKRLRNVPGKVVAGNMVCLFLAYLFFLLRHIPGLAGTQGCTVVAILINYSFLASFTFNIIYAAFIVHSLDSMEHESGVASWTALWLWMIGLLAPFTVIIPAIVVDHIPGNLYKPRYGGEICFINNEIGLTLYFIAPMAICLLIAVVLYLVIVIKLVQLAKETKLVRSDHSEKISIAIKLLVVLGFNWIFAVIAAIDRGQITTFIFIVTCTLQGFFGFIVFICNRATLVDVKKCLNKQANMNFEMSSSNQAASRKNGTMSTDTTASKDKLHHKDSSTILLSRDEVPV